MRTTWPKLGFKPGTDVSFPILCWIPGSFNFNTVAELFGTRMLSGYIPPGNDRITSTLIIDFSEKLIHFHALIYLFIGVIPSTPSIHSLGA